MEPAVDGSERSDGGRRGLSEGDGRLRRTSPSSAAARRREHRSVDGRRSLPFPVGDYEDTVSA